MPQLLNDVRIRK